MSTHPDSTDTSYTPKVVKRVIGSDFEQFVELVRAAATIGLGVELVNRLQPAPQGGFTEEWTITLYNEPPGRSTPDR
ncbi:hypothetical protein Sme01_20220 [Sphaerisporangium melleum]|uniref:Uncharacterized protein n=1 Tax=Sphaerisporangium melleum TaxID=321316 RepID=A0A917RL76_9ACTN|nr:hypothetical protein [Sphaerisporangium melleum]GGL13049.1 hypothetical protein GCM10007964_63950 [Sphaerisporangium melleum]GII69546.1 hypothetical protein Sme01_20220 [Sphaerisporangium melleum]